MEPGQQPPYDKEPQAPSDPPPPPPPSLHLSPTLPAPTQHAATATTSAQATMAAASELVDSARADVERRLNYETRADLDVAFAYFEALRDSNELHTAWEGLLGAVLAQQVIVRWTKNEIAEGNKTSERFVNTARDLCKNKFDYVFKVLEQETWTRIIKICIEIASPHLDGTPTPFAGFVTSRSASSGYVLSGVPPNGFVFPTQYGEDGARLGVQSLARPPVELIMPGMATLHPELNPQDRQPRPLVELIVANAGPSHTRPTPDPAPADAIADFLGEPAAGPAEPAINAVIAVRDAATAPRRAREANAACQRLVDREVSRRQLQILKIKKLRDVQARQRLYLAHWAAGREAAFMAAARKRREVKDRKQELDAQRHRSYGKHYVVDAPVPLLPPMSPRVPPLGEAGPGPTTQNARAARQVDVRANMAEVYRELVQPAPRPQRYNFTTQAALETFNEDAELVMRYHRDQHDREQRGLTPDVVSPPDIENAGMAVQLGFAPLPNLSLATETESMLEVDDEDVLATATAIGAEAGPIRQAEPRPAPAPHPAPQELSPADVARDEAVQRARLQQLADRGIAVPGNTAAATSDPALHPVPHVGQEMAISQSTSQHAAQPATLPDLQADIVDHSQKNAHVQQAGARAAPPRRTRRARVAAPARVPSPPHPGSPQAAPGNTPEPRMYTPEQFWAVQYMSERDYDVGGERELGPAAPRQALPPANDPQSIGLTPRQEALLQSTRPQRGPWVQHLNLADPVYQLPEPQSTGVLVPLEQTNPVADTVEAATIPAHHATEVAHMPSRQQDLPHAGPITQPMEAQPSALHRAVSLERPPVRHPPLPHSHVLRPGAERRLTGTLPGHGTQDVDMSELFTLPPEILAQGERVVFAPRTAAAQAHAADPAQAPARQQQQQIQGMNYGSAPPQHTPPQEPSMAVPQAPLEPQLQPLSDEEFAQLAALAMQIQYDGDQYGDQYDVQYDLQYDLQYEPQHTARSAERRAASLEGLEGDVNLAKRQAQRQKREARRTADREARVARGEPPSPPKAKRVYKRKNAHQRTRSGASQESQDRDQDHEHVSAVDAQDVQQHQALAQQARIYAVQAARMREVSMMMGAVPHSDQSQYQHQLQPPQPPPELTLEVVVPNYGEMVHQAEEQTQWYEHQAHPAAVPRQNVTAQQYRNQLQNPTVVPPHTVPHQDWPQGAVQQDANYSSQQALQQAFQPQLTPDIQPHAEAEVQHAASTQQAGQPANWWIKQEMAAPQDPMSPMHDTAPVDQFPSAVQMEREFAAYQEADYRQRLALDQATAYLGIPANTAQQQHTPLLPPQPPYRPFDVSMPDPSTSFHSPFSADPTVMGGWSEPMWDPQHTQQPQASLSASLVADAAWPYAETPASAGWAALQSAFMSSATQGTRTWFDVPPSAPAGTPHLPTPPPAMAISEPPSQYPTPLPYMPTPQTTMSSHDSSTQPTPLMVTPARLPPMFTREDMERAMGVSPAMLTPSPRESPFPTATLGDEYPYQLQASQGAASGSGSDTLAPHPNIGGGSRKRTLSEYTASPAADEGVEAPAPAPPAKKRKPYTKKADKVAAEPKPTPKPSKPRAMPRPKKNVEYTNGLLLAAFHARNAIHASSTQSQPPGISGASGVAGAAGLSLPIASPHPGAAITAITTANHAHSPGQPSPRVPLNQKQPNATRASAHSHMT